MPSTGPKTAAGKRASSRNALSHGILSTLPVLPNESAEAWEAHLAGTLEGLAPVGHLEGVLAERVALVLWRLARLARYEQDATVHYYENTLHSVQVGVQLAVGVLRLTLPQLTAREESIGESLRCLQALAESPDDGALDSGDAARILDILASTAGWKHDALVTMHYPGIGLHQEAPSLQGWTARKLRACAALLAKPFQLSAPALLDRARARLCADLACLREARPLLSQRVEDARTLRSLPDAPDLDKLVRYESHLRRLLSSTLFELQVLQERRRRAPDPAAPAPVPAGPDEEPSCETSAAAEPASPAAPPNSAKRTAPAPESPNSSGRSGLPQAPSCAAPPRPGRPGGARPSQRARRAPRHRPARRGGRRRKG